MGGGLSYHDLTMDIPININKILKLKIEQGLNKHAKAFITVIFSEDEGLEAINKIKAQTNIKVKSKEGEIIFSGIPTKVTINHEADLYSMALVLSSYSICLDYQLKSRSFQNSQGKYKELFEKVIKDHDGMILDTVSKSRVQEGVIIQYEETDWEFMKRAASHLGAKIFPEIKGSKPKIYIGINEGDKAIEANHNYGIENDIKAYLEAEKNHGGWKQQDMIFYTVESMENYELGDKITYKKVGFVVVGKVSELQKGLLIHSYTLQSEKGIKTPKIYNDKIKGLSIDGEVIAVEKDCVKLHLAIDDTQSMEEAKWYQVETTYTTEGSTGYYSMPQEGASVKLYIRERDEREAYIKGLNQLDSEKIKISPQEFTLSAVENMMHIKMTYDTGIEVISQEDIKLKTEKTMTIECETMEMISKDKIICATKSASIILDEIVHVKGQ